MISVLAADDHPLARAGLQQLLGTLDGIALVGVAASADEAVRLAVEHAPDVVLMDIEMPGKDGIQATRELLAERPGTPVVILTSFSDRDRILAALDAGAVGYVLKDAQPDELARAIEAAAAGQAPLHPLAARELLADRHAVGPQLSAREEEVLALLAQGLPNKLIARRLEISERTVKGHLTHIFERIGVSDRTQAALWARERGVT
ncbi:MAG TPA: response regulator transcription factor [Solirubrobacteraceae bacterium]|nr:response regulator transcription factor [Solirubrobacteraceae bacterium]